MRVKQAGQKTSLAEQGTTYGAQEEKEIVHSLKAYAGFEGRLQSCNSYMQGEDMKRKSSIRAETGQRCVRQHKRL